MFDTVRRLVTGKGANSQAMFNTLGLVVLYGVNFFTLPLFSRLMGAAGFGTFSLFTSWAQIGTVIVGLQVAATIPMAAVHFDQHELERYTAAVLTLMTLAAAVLLPVMIIWDAPIAHLMGLDGIPSPLVLAQAYFAAVVGLASQLFINQLQALLNFVLSASLILVSVILSGVLMLGPLRDRPADGRILGALLGYVLAGAGLAVLLYVRGRVLYDKAAWAFCLPISIPLILHGLSAVVLAQIGKVLLQQISGSRDLVGYYGMAVTVASLLQALVYALNNTWVPVFYRMLAGQDADGLGDVGVRASRYVFLFTGLASGLVLIAPEVVRIFAGSGFGPAVGIMPLMIGAVFFMFLYLLPVNYELYVKNSRYVSVGTVVAAVVSVAIGWPLISAWGLVGAAWSNLLAYVLLLLFHGAICHVRMPGYPFSWRLFVAPILIYAAAAVAMVLVPWWPVRWILAAGVGAVLVVRVVRARTLF